eukprot:2231673-Pyramimonas_sp.AAC.1
MRPEAWRGGRRDLRLSDRRCNCAAPAERMRYINALIACGIENEIDYDSACTHQNTYGKYVATCLLSTTSHKRRPRLWRHRRPPPRL